MGLKLILSAIYVFAGMLGLEHQLLAAEIQGHRGSRWTHPENTLPAFQEALEAGADVLELDLGMTSDEVLIVSHDEVLNDQVCRYSDGKPITQKQILYKMTAKEAKNFDCGAMINPKFPQQKTILNTQMPTFDEFLVWLKSNNHPNAKKVILNVETKIEKPEEGLTATPEKFAKALAKSLKKHDVVARTVVQSFDFRSLGEIRKILPKVKIALLVWEQKWPEIDKAITDYKADIVSPPFAWLDENIVKEIHAKKLQVIPWTVNEEKDWQNMIKLGVDGIITDRPRDLITFLKK